MKNKLFIVFGILTIMFLGTTPVNAEYLDVNAHEWYYESVSWAEENGLMCGYTDSIFAPDDKLTRAQAVTIIYRMCGSPDYMEYTDMFSDVREGDWYADAVIWANKARIAFGYGDIFGAADQVTREQFVTMLYRYTTYLANIVNSKDEEIKHFSDSDKVSVYAQIPMKWAYGYGIISGRADGMLNPQGYTTRAECASIIQRYAKEYGIEFRNSKGEKHETN